jgi:hypothetical protein
MTIETTLVVLSGIATIVSLFSLWRALREEKASGINVQDVQEIIFEHRDKISVGSYLATSSSIQATASRRSVELFRIEIPPRAAQRYVMCPGH